MFVPFVFNMSTFSEAPFLWWFYKGLDFIKQTKSAIIAQEIYCTKTPSEFAADGRNEPVNLDFVNEHWFYHLPKNSDLKTEKVYAIPDALLDEIVQEKGSISDAFCALLMQSDKRLESFLCDLICRIESECGEEIEGFMTLMQFPSLTEAAKRYNIPVIHFELGCWREPTYLHTAFWDLEDLQGGNTLERRWKRFSEERLKRPICIFSKKECLALLLQKNYLGHLELCNKVPKKKIGVALGYATYEIFGYKTHLTDSELLYRTKKHYGLDNMLVRKHPGDPYGAQYPRYGKVMDGMKKSTAEFITDCETVISLLSGTGMEAMLYDRKAITLLPSPSYFASGHEIEGEGLCAGEDFISFFAFCYLIPLEYLTDVEYLRWRLTNPSEREIYYKHIEFYFEKKKLPKELIIQETGSRLEKMLSLQGYQR
jgi:hypothetical protein